MRAFRHSGWLYIRVRSIGVRGCVLPIECWCRSGSECGWRWASSPRRGGVWCSTSPAGSGRLRRCSSLPGCGCTNAREQDSVRHNSEGLPEVIPGHREQRLVISGIRARVRHPIYLGHLCEMLAWSVGTGLAVCFGLTVFALVTGAIMIRLEDAELEQRFGEEYRQYKRKTPAMLPRVFLVRHGRDVASNVFTMIARHYNRNSAYRTAES